MFYIQIIVICWLTGALLEHFASGCVWGRGKITCRECFLLDLRNCWGNFLHFVAVPLVSLIHFGEKIFLVFLFKLLHTNKLREARLKTILGLYVLWRI